jgi:uncharacterized Zn finger protein
MENEINKVTLVQCPRCGSEEHCIEAVTFMGHTEYWARCRQCDWTMGELPNINDKTGGKK